MKVLLATNNAHKADEIRNALDFPGWEFVTLREAGIESDPAEDADSFLGNARIKAQAAREASGGMAVLADDSGLEVDALGGGPGVYSARFAGPDCNDEANNALLLQKLENTPEFLRTARFVCTLVFLDEDGNETVARGVVNGRIGHSPSGDNGFGYDPLFYPDEYGHQTSFAEVPQNEKSQISHRGRALFNLREKLEVVYNADGHSDADARDESAPVAQRIEHRTSNPTVAGSSPVRRTRQTPGRMEFPFYLFN